MFTCSTDDLAIYLPWNFFIITASPDLCTSSSSNHCVPTSAESSALAQVQSTKIVSDTSLSPISQPHHLDSLPHYPFALSHHCDGLLQGLTTAYLQSGLINIGMGVLWSQVMSFHFSACTPAETDPENQNKSVFRVHELGVTRLI